jgi:hypothetical protein
MLVINNKYRVRKLDDSNLVIEQLKIVSSETKGTREEWVWEGYYTSVAGALNTLNLIYGGTIEYFELIPEWAGAIIEARFDTNNDGSVNRSDGYSCQITFGESFDFTTATASCEVIGKSIPYFKTLSGSSSPVPVQGLQPSSASSQHPSSAYRTSVPCHES